LSAWAEEPATPPPAPAALVVDAKVPAEVLLAGVKLGELYFPATVQFSISPGTYPLRVYVGGTPTDLEVELTSGAQTSVVVGRSGVSIAGTTAAPPVSTEPASVEFRMVGRGAVRLSVEDGDGAPAVGRLATGETLALELLPGPHALSLRSGDGTVIWATGALHVAGSGPVVVLVSEGRLPEVSGGGAFLGVGG
jgi:hypothetical protein